MAKSNNFYSPLRYPGGKSKLISFIKSIYERNDLLGKTYIEPYTGGGAIALSLLIDGYANDVIINDYDRSIYAFWHSILHQPDEFCRLILNTPITMDVWREQKNIQKNKGSAGILELGFSTFFLNRTNRSGILKAGVIGGNTQSGEWKMNVRFNKTDLLKRIELIHKYSSRIKLYNQDTCELLDTLSDSHNSIKNSFIYLDPPYYSKGKDLYINFYNHNDHVELSKKIASLQNTSWLLSYDNNQEIKKLYPLNKKITYNLTYTIERKYQGSEIIIYSDNITLPLKNSNLKNVSRIIRRKEQNMTCI